MKQNNCVEIVEVFRTERGSVSQCNKTNTYLLAYAGVTSSFKATNFLDFIKRVNSIDLEEMIFSSSSVTDVTVLMPPYSDRCFVLTLTDVIDLKNLLSGAKFSLHLHSVLCECLKPQVFHI